MYAHTLHSALLAMRSHNVSIEKPRAHAAAVIAIDINGTIFPHKSSQAPRTLFFYNFECLTSSARSSASFFSRSASSALSKAASFSSFS